MNLPEIRINFSELLYENVSPGFAKDMGEKLPAMDDCYIWAANYRIAWAEHEQKLLQAMIEALGVSFYKPIIDVSLAPFFIPQSDPLIVNFKAEPDQFVDMLAHELIHVLFTDNNKVRIRDSEPKLNLIDAWHELFGKDHDFNALIHIPVHAVLKHLYLDVLADPSRLERDVQESAQFAGGGSYVKAWDYVNQTDYKKVIAQLRESYAAV